MDDDGGLSAALARQRFSRELESENARREQSLVEEALAEQRPRVEKAIATFLAEARKLGIAPERVKVGLRRVEFQRRGFWGWTTDFRLEDVHEPGYVLKERLVGAGENAEWQRLVVFESGQVKLDYDAYGAIHNQHRGALPFHQDRNGLRKGSVRDGTVEGQIRQVRNDELVFVNWLAEYLGRREESKAR